jgi:hypothetical protein
MAGGALFAPPGPSSIGCAPIAHAGAGGQGSEPSESEKRRPDGEARYEPAQRVTFRAGASQRRP